MLDSLTSLVLDSTSVLLFGVTFWLSCVVIKFKTRNPTGKKSPPCLPFLPFIGSLPFIPTDFAQIGKFFMEKAEELGPVFGFYSGNSYTLVLNGREAIEEALIKHSLAFADRKVLVFEENYSNVRRKGLAHTHYDERYKSNRKLSVSIMKIFGFGAANIMESRIHGEIEAMIEEVNRFKGGPFNPSKVLSLSVSNVILSILFGHRFDYNDPQFQRLIQYSHEYVVNSPLVIEIIPILQYAPSVRRQISNIIKIMKNMFEIIEEEIKSSVRSREDNFVKRYMMDMKENYDKEELLYTLRDLIIGGTDTSMNTLLWAMIMLANNPKVQSSIREEIYSVVPRTRLPSLDDKPNLPYTEASMTELLRWRTLLPIGLPRQTMCDTEVNGFHIPSGTQVIANLYGVHMDPRVWKEPEKFKPERFLDGDGKFLGGEGIVSFSLGRRSCLGEVLARQEIFLFLSALVQRFEVLPPEGQSTIDGLETWNVIVSPQPFQVRLIPRSSDGNKQLSFQRGTTSELSASSPHEILSSVNLNKSELWPDLRQHELKTELLV